MKYLSIMPDYTGSCIKDDFSGEFVDLESMDLPKDFLEEILNWHSAYRKIIPLSEKERNKSLDEIEKLDIHGINIARKLIKLKNIKVKYFSEGKLEYIYFTEEEKMKI
ncbi:MAG: hypothetical protein ACRCYP_07410 [Alphaproteobacteria bacterium]